MTNPLQIFRSTVASNTPALGTGATDNNVGYNAADNEFFWLDNNSIVRSFNMFAASIASNLNWDIQNAIQRSGTSVFVDNDEPSGIFVSKDGIKMYVTRFGDDSLPHIDEYTLSIPFDETSKTLINTLSISGVTLNAASITFNEALTRFIVGQSKASGTGSIHEWTLSVAGNISTATFNVTKSIDADLTTGSIRDTHYAKDDTRLYVAVTDGTQDVLQYNLSAAGELGTAVFTTRFSTGAEVTNIVDAFVGDFGNKLFIGDDPTDKLKQYSLPTPYEINTAVLDTEDLDISVSITSFSSMHMTLHGALLYVTDTSGDDVTSFAISTEGNNAFTNSEKTKLANTAQLDVAQEYTATQNFNATILTDAANISWDASANQVTSVTLAGNRTLDNPTNLVDGATYIITVKQDGTGSRTLAYGSAYKFPGGTAPTLSTGANDVDIITFVSDGASMFGVFQGDFS